MKGKEKEKKRNKGKQKEKINQHDKQGTIQAQAGAPVGAPGKKTSGRQIDGGGGGLRAPFFNFALGRQN